MDQSSLCLCLQILRPDEFRAKIASDFISPGATVALVQTDAHVLKERNESERTWSTASHFDLVYGVDLSDKPLPSKPVSATSMRVGRK